jgi:hypothetical protein
MDHRPRKERSRDRANQGIAAFIPAGTSTRPSAAVSAVQYAGCACGFRRSRRPSMSGLLRRRSWSDCARVGTPMRVAHPLAGLPPSDGLSAGEDPRWRRAARCARSKTATFLPVGVLGVISGVDAMLPPKMVITASSGIAAVVASAMTTVRRTAIVAVAASAMPGSAAVF